MLIVQVASDVAKIMKVLLTCESLKKHDYKRRNENKGLVSLILVHKAHNHPNLRIRAGAFYFSFIAPAGCG